MNGSMDKTYSIKEKTPDYILNIDFDIQDKSWLDNINGIQSIIMLTTKETFNHTKISKKAKEIEFSITLASNEIIQKLNLQYRQKDKPTNCLSFPAQEIDMKKINKIKFHDGFILLGDVIFAYDVIKNESLEQKKSFNDHFSHLLIHSLLHLHGFNHENDNEAKEMESLEVEILSSLGINSPYN